MRSGIACPEQSRLTILEIDCRAEDALEGVGQLTASFRWLALRPVGPGTDPKGKDLTQLSIGSII